jgi:hypothetical protein
MSKYMMDNKYLLHIAVFFELNVEDRRQDVSRAQVGKHSIMNNIRMVGKKGSKIKIVLQS